VWVADDLVAKLTDQVRDLEQPGWYDTNPALRFQCFISADGKGMQASHRLDGAKCWTCAHQVDGPLAGVPGPLCFQFPVRFFPWFNSQLICDGGGWTIVIDVTYRTRQCFFLLFRCRWDCLCTGDEVSGQLFFLCLRGIVPSQLPHGGWG
jgi:hypothetical protein